jgi:hypothetical protein
MQKDLVMAGTRDHNERERERERERRVGFKDSSSRQ